MRRQPWIIWVPSQLPLWMEAEGDFTDRRGKINTRKRGGCEDKGRDWSDVAASQGMPSATRSYSEAKNRFSPRAPEGVWISDFWPPERWANKFLLLQATEFVVLYSNRLRKWIQYTFGFVLCLGPLRVGDECITVGREGQTTLKHRNRELRASYTMHI